MSELVVPDCRVQLTSIGEKYSLATAPALVARRLHGLERLPHLNGEAAGVVGHDVGGTGLSMTLVNATSNLLRHSSKVLQPAKS